MARKLKKFKSCLDFWGGLDHGYKLYYHSIYIRKIVVPYFKKDFLYLGGCSAFLAEVGRDFAKVYHHSF